MAEPAAPTLAPAAPEPSSSRKPPLLSVYRAALIGFASLLVGIGLGRFGYPALIPAVVEAGWVTPEIAHIAGASNLAGYLFGALIAIRTIAWLGARATVRAMLWLTAASFAVSCVPVPASIFIALRFLAGATGGVLMIAVAPLIAASVDPRRRGTAGGWSFAGVGAGFILSGTVVPLVANHGLALAWLAIAAILALASIVALLAMPAEVAIVSSASASPAGRVRTPPRKLAVFGVAVAYSCAAAGYVPHTVVYVDYVARILGYGLGAGGAIWIATGAGAVLSPILAGWFADRFGFALALRLVLAIMTAGVIIPTVTSAMPWLLLSGVLGGGFMIAAGSLVAGRAREVAAPGRHAAMWSLLTIIFAVVQAGAAYATSAFLAWHGGYVALFAIAAAIIAFGLIVDIATARAGAG
jgi:MFS family permease